MQNEPFTQPLAQQGQAGKENDSLPLIAFALPRESKLPQYRPMSRGLMRPWVWLLWLREKPRIGSQDHEPVGSILGTWAHQGDGHWAQTRGLPGGHCCRTRCPGIGTTLPHYSSQVRLAWCMVSLCRWGLYWSFHSASVGISGEAATKSMCKKPKIQGDLFWSFTSWECAHPWIPLNNRVVQRT